MLARKVKAMQQALTALLSGHSGLHFPLVCELFVLLHTGLKQDDIILYNPQRICARVMSVCNFHLHWSPELFTARNFCVYHCLHAIL